MKYKLVSPTGAEVFATVEHLYAKAMIQDPMPSPNGPCGFDFEYSGESEMYWDSQKTCRDENGERLFLDAEFEQWPESELKLVPEIDCLPTGEQSSAVVTTPPC
jgi:hypothetical protein